MNTPFDELNKDAELIEFTEFVSDLSMWASKYIKEIAEALMLDASNLYEDKAIVVLVHEYAETHRREVRDRKNHLYKLATEGEDAFSLWPSYYEERVSELDDILYMLLASRI